VKTSNLSYVLIILFIQVPGAYGDIVEPKDGVIIHGLFLDGGKWDTENMILIDPHPGEIFRTVVLFHNMILTALIHSFCK
jgi:hypothetical protein